MKSLFKSGEEEYLLHQYKVVKIFLTKFRRVRINGTMKLNVYLLEIIKVYINVIRGGWDK